MTALTFENDEEADDILMSLCRQRERIQIQLGKVQFGRERETLRADQDAIQAMIAAVTLWKAEPVVVSAPMVIDHDVKANSFIGCIGMVFRNDTEFDCHITVTLLNVDYYSVGDGQ